MKWQSTIWAHAHAQGRRWMGLAADRPWAVGCHIECNNQDLFIFHTHMFTEQWLLPGPSEHVRAGQEVALSAKHDDLSIQLALTPSSTLVTETLKALNAARAKHEGQGSCQAAAALEVVCLGSQISPDQLMPPLLAAACAHDICGSLSAGGQAVECK
eukprot:scaffold43790_cov19-Tisochrysis_lutea.AAC.1